MKKTVLAFAVAAAMGVPAVAAADVTLYGRIHASLDRVDNGADKSTQVVGNRASRLGVRGSEDLGGGLRGVFQIESTIDVAGDGGGNQGFATRDSFVGLAGEFGEVRVGRSITPYHQFTAGQQVMGDSILDTRAIITSAVGTGGDDQRTNAANRDNNTLMYRSPNFSGFQAIVHYSTDQGATDDRAGPNANDNDVISVGGSYSQGPIGAFAAYDKRNAALSANEVTSWTVGGSYRLDDLRLTAQYDNVELGSASRNAYALAARYDMGQVFLTGVYANRSDMDNTNNTSATLYGLGAGYNFSRRTTVYAAYAQMDNDAQSGTSLFNTNSGTTGGDGSAFSLGVQHNF